jgi:lipoprotein-anchoring transpeptidase ErfK/SrfK
VIKALASGSLYILLVALAAFRSADAQGADLWIDIDTRNLTLAVMEGGEIRQVFENISIGRGGTTSSKQRRDDKTPLGEFRIVRITGDTPFRRYFGFDYPNLEHAGHALQAGRISQRQYSDIRKALRAQKVPPQHTALGGYIGIHGIGAGDERIHADFNWTNGCIALKNSQIDDLAQFIRLGMRVIVR